MGLFETLRTPAVARRAGRAEYASQKAKLGEARKAKDRRTEREVATSLSRWLAERGLDLDAAVLLARRALSIEDDAALRAELGAWLAAMGEHALVAADARKLAEARRGPASAREWARAGELLARAGDVPAAAEALRAAAEADPQVATPLEILGTLSIWAPSQIAEAVGLSAFAEAAQRRARARDAEGSFEDRLRAHDLAPADEAAADALAVALVTRGRAGAADEVLRASAERRGEAGRTAHLRRAREGLSTGDLPRAVGAALDAVLDAVLEGSDGALYDDILSRTGLYEQLASRLELRAETAPAGHRRAAAYVELARLCGGPLASVERSLEAWIEALSADASCSEAKSALRAHAGSMRDQGPLVEGLLRAAQGGLDGSRPEAGEPGAEASRSCLRELLQVAEDSLSDPSLALFAVEQLAMSGAIDEPSLKAVRGRLGPRVRLQDEALSQAEAAVERARKAGDREARVEALRRLASHLRGRPRQVGRFLEVLAELVSLTPEDRGAWQQLERTASRAGGEALLEQAYRERLSSPSLPRSELVRARLGLSALARRRGDRRGALAEAAPLLAQAPSHRGAASAVATLAALENDQPQRAEALAQLAAPLAPPLRGMLLSVASGALLASGDRARARALAEQACQADPTLPRAVSALSASVWGARDRVAAAALERSAGVLVPSSSLCAELSATLEALGEASASVDWARRWLALRPADVAGCGALLSRAARLGDAARLSDAIAWVLTMPAPASQIAGPVAEGIVALSALAPEAAEAAVRRASDVLGVRHRALREAMVSAAEAGGDFALASLLLERWASSGAEGQERLDALVALADSRRKQGDVLGESRALARALREGASADEVLARLSTMAEPVGPDAQLARLEALAEALAEGGPARAQLASEAFRDLGAARWDWAGDPAGAVRAWVRAADLDPRRGPARLVRDLFAFGGPERALDELLAYAEQKKEPAEAALVHALAALAAFESSQPLQAFTAAERSVLLDPSRTEALGIAEKTAEAAGDPQRLAALYDALSRAAKGRFGRRAAHYRAARQLERRGASALAARHAIAAFEAVPSVGMTYVLMSRLAQRADLTGEAVASISRVAEQATHDLERAQWLRRAAALSTSGEEGARMRVDILLRALRVHPTSRTVQDVAEALSTLVTSYGEAQDAAEMRFERAQRSALSSLDGPEGARIAVAFAAAALRVFAAGRLAIAALARALEADADVDEYASLLGEVDRLAEAELEDPRAGFASRCRAMLKKPFTNLGPAALRLAGAVAAARRDMASAVELFVAAARRAPDDNALVAEAERLLALTGDDELRAQLHDAFPVARRVEALAFLAEERERGGDLPGAIEALERALSVEGMPGGQRDSTRNHLRDLYLRTGRRDALESFLLREMERPEASAAERVAVARELSPLLAARGHAERAAAVLEEAIRLQPSDPRLRAELVDIARQAGDGPRLLSALAALVDGPAERAGDAAARAASLRELAKALEEAGERDEAARRWAELSSLEPRDREALAALERLAMHRGDYETLARVLAARVALGGDLEEVRVLRLRRAALLEQRLGRLDDARAELEALLDQIGDDASATRFLADLHERLGAPLRAGPLWMRAFRLQVDPRDRADLAVRAAQAFLRGGDHAQARAALDAALLLSRSERLLELRVDLERRSENPRGLADALDELAIASMDPPEKRAELLVEAAHASLAAGDEIAGLERAQRAARIAPSSPGAQLLARLLEYRARGAGTPQEAQHTIEELRRISGRLADAQIPLHAFLMAEALDVVHGGNAGMRELSARHAEIGAASLIALGMAERLARMSSFSAALPFFDAALASDVHGTRRRGSIALAAADAAARVDDLDRAGRYLEEAASDPATAQAARQRQAQLAQAQRARGEGAPPLSAAPRSISPGSGTAAPGAPVLGAPASAVAPRASATPPQGSPVVAPPPPAPSAPPPRAPSQPPPSAAPRQASAPPPAPAAVEVVPAGNTVPAPPPDFGAPPAERASAPPETVPRGSTPPPELAPASKPPGVVPRASTPPEAAAAGPRSERPSALSSPPTPPVLTPLAPSSYPSPSVMRAAQPAADAVSEARRAFLAQPADRAALSALREAASTDHNVSLVRAVDHVLASFTPGEPPQPPPPLSAQREEPEYVHRLLLRGSGGTVADALALVWDSASSLFRREAGTYGVTGLDRVSFGGHTVASRVYSAAARLLGASRTPLFQRRSSGPVTASVALLVPPAVVLAGDPRDETPELLFRVGAALVAASPELALLFGLPEGQLRVLLSAMVMAFGPTPPTRGANPSVAQLAETLWQTLPARLQRRMAELCSRPSEFGVESALALARRTTRRAGLLLAGDLPTALREVAAEERLKLASPLETLDGLAAACQAHPELADLLALATSAEYADARFRAADNRFPRPRPASR